MLKKSSLLLIMVLALVISGCQSAKNDKFAIYLLTEENSATELSQIEMSQLVLKNEPIISSTDIVSYDKASHIIELTQTAFTRLQKIFPMSVKVNGIPFVVCVGKERIYTGAFWTPVSSLSFDGVVIMQPIGAKETTIQISLGYPVPQVFTGDDPRADPRIIKALERDKKLKQNRLGQTDITIIVIKGVSRRILLHLLAPLTIPHCREASVKVCVKPIYSSS